MRTIRPMTEREWQAQVVQCLELHGWRVYHTYDSRRSQPGFPDLVASHKALRATIHVELKTETGKTSPAQDDWLDTLAASGYATVWRPSDWDEVLRVAQHGPRGGGCVFIVDGDGQTDEQMLRGSR